MMNNSQGASSFFSGLSTLLGRPHPLLHNLSDTTRLDAWDLLVIYLDGIQMGSHHVLAAVGVDSDGKKHVLGVREGASENAEVTSALLEDLVERGLDPGRTVV